MSLITHARRPLLICHTLAGDLLMAVPTLRLLKERYGTDAPVVCGAEPEHQMIFRQVGFTNLHPREFRARSLAAQMVWDFDIDSVLPLGDDCDLFINLAEGGGPDFSTIATKFRLPSVGFHKNADLRIRFDGATIHIVERYFAVARALSASAHVNDYAYFPHRSDAQSVRAMVREEVGPGRLVVVHADTKVEKMWPLERWAAWLKRLWAHEPDTRVVLLGYPAIPIENYAVDSRLHDCRDLPLTVNYEIAGMADLFVGIDSCMIHAADLCRVPAVGIFTNGFPPWYCGMRFADGESLIGANPPDDVAVEAVWEAYCRVRDRQWRRAVQEPAMTGMAAE